MGVLGTTNFTKLAGETDFNDLVDKLFQVESRYANQLIKWRDDWKQRLEGFSKVRAELSNLRTALSGIDTVDKFLMKNATSSKDQFVTAKASAQALPGTYKVDVDRLASNNVWSIDTGLIDKNDVINPGPATGEFVYNFKGKDYTVKVPAGTTLNGMKNIINNNSTYKGVQATIIQGGSGAIFQLGCTESGEGAPMYIKSVTNIPQMPLSLENETWKFDSNGTITSTFGTALPTDPLIDPSDPQKTFTLLVDGKKFAFTIEPGKTMDDLAQKITDYFALPVHNGAYINFSATTVVSDGKTCLQIDPGSAKSDITAINSNLRNLIDPAKIELNQSITVPADQIVTYSLKVDGKEYSITKTAGETYTPQDIINSLKTDKNVNILLVGPDQGGGMHKISLNNGSTSTSLLRDRSALPTSEGTYDALDFQPPTAPGWITQRAENARVRVNGLPVDPEWLESSSNQVKDVIEGMTFNLHDKGTSIITVSIDSEGITENVKKFVDAANELRKVINELSAVDKDKKPLDPEVAVSQFEMQKGSVLTGNYGVQLMNSMVKQLTAGICKGFIHAQTENKVLVYGDKFSSLGNVGITTNAKESNPMFGMLEIKMFNDGKAGKTFAEALAEDPLAVAELFAAKSEGKSHSSAFGYASHVANLTKVGNHTVEYSMKEDPPASGMYIPDESTIRINGEQGKYYADTKQIGLANAPGNAANGLMLDVFDWSSSPKSGVVSIRDGKVNEMINMLDGEQGMLNTQKGILGILERNYKTIAGNIDKKIISEDSRLKKWASTTRLRFARLEGTLAFYNAKQDGLKSQLTQLNQK